MIPFEPRLGTNDFVDDIPILPTLSTYRQNMTTSTGPSTQSAVSSSEDWRYFWDSRRPPEDHDDEQCHKQKQPSNQPTLPLQHDLQLVSAEDWGREAFLGAAVDLLSEHYVEDTSGQFRFKLDIEFLQWAVDQPAVIRICSLG